MRSNGEGKPVVALDIDGTLGDYHGHFLRFAEGYWDCWFPNASMENPGVPLWEFMQISKEKYREAKLAYRQGGQKRTMPIYAGAGAMTSVIRSLGAEVWICTSRPYLRLDNIDPDTREWLRRAGIEYDAVLFDTLDGKGTKYAELKRQAGDRVASIVDDLPEMVETGWEQMPENSPLPILRTQPYNTYFEWPRRVSGCGEMLAEIRSDLAAWKGIYGE